MRKANELGVAVGSAVYAQWLLPVLLAISSSVYADTLPLPAGVPAPSFVNDMVLIDDVGNPDDTRGGNYGGVNYKYRVSATQITVGDWVAFLNAVDPGNTMGFEPIASSGCGNNFCFSAYTYSGGTWSVTAFNDDGMSMTAAQAAKLPIDWLSLNMVARYMNWLATGNIEQGAFTFAQSGSPLGNRAITAFDANYPGPRLPLEDELYKAMFWDKTKQAYNTYPTNNLLGDGTPVLAGVDGSGMHNSNVGGTLIPGYGGTLHYAQVGQETGNPWGLFDVAGNRHETTLEPSAPTSTILRGAAAFGSVSQSRYDFRDTLGVSYRFLSIGYRVWMGVSAPAGTIKITKQVMGGTDPQAFSVNLDCTDNNFDKTGISIKAGAFYESDAIPAGTQCTVAETAPTAPTGFTYAAAAYNPGQTVTVGDGTVVNVTITNTLQAAATPKIDLEVTKVVDKPNVKSGDTVKYTITVTNKGPDTATGVEVTDQLPAGVKYKAPNTASQGAYDDTTGIWVVGTLAKDIKATLTIYATVD